jgi:hypothetical protein
MKNKPRKATSSSRSGLSPARLLAPPWSVDEMHAAPVAEAERKWRTPRLRHRMLDDDARFPRISIL